MRMFFAYLLARLLVSLIEALPADELDPTPIERPKSEENQHKDN